MQRASRAISLFNFLIFPVWLISATSMTMYLSGIEDGGMGDFYGFVTLTPVNVTAAYIITFILGFLSMYDPPHWENDKDKPLLFALMGRLTALTGGLALIFCLFLLVLFLPALVISLFSGHFLVLVPIGLPFLVIWVTSLRKDG